MKLDTPHFTVLGGSPTIFLFCEISYLGSLQSSKKISCNVANVLPYWPAESGLLVYTHLVL